MTCMNSGVAWTNGTHNFFRGCSLKDRACLNCYAMHAAASGRLGAPGKAYHGLTRNTRRGPVWTGEVRAALDVLEDPLHQRKPQMIFSNSMSDWQHESLSYELRAALLSTYLRAPQHVYQLLTKRHDRQREFFERRARAVDEPLPPWFWVGVSVTHRGVIGRIEQLRHTPGIAMRWVSFEPLLEDLGVVDLTGINWIVVGGESEHRKKAPARAMHSAWAHNLMCQARRQGVKVFFKQWGKWRSIFHLPEQEAWAAYRRAAFEHFTFEGAFAQYKRETDETPDALEGGLDWLERTGDQSFNLWQGAKIENYPARRFYPEQWPH